MLADVATRIAALWASAPLLFKVLFTFACVVTATDLLLKWTAPKSKAYAAFKHGLEAIGAFWTAIILSIVYFLSVSVVNLGLRLAGHDPLDRKLAPEPSFWRAHDPNPLGVTAAARLQF